MKHLLQLPVMAVLTAALAAAPNAKDNHTIVTLTHCTLTPVPFAAHHHGAAPRVRNRDGTSSNWGGYAVETSLTAPQKNAVTAVQGSWVIPTVSPSASAQTYSAFWVGIDGYDDNTVEQLGTEQDWTSGGPEYSVWFEMYPHNSYNITGFPIAPGDVFSASVKYTGGGNFVLSITNVTRRVAYTVPAKNTKMNNAQLESAEWIAEAPWQGGVLPLADFGTSAFLDCSATVNGVTGAIDNSRWQFDNITMTATGGTVKAQPSVLTDAIVNGVNTSGFAVQWFHE